MTTSDGGAALVPVLPLVLVLHYLLAPLLRKVDPLLEAM